jgi:hypothetical protein
MEDKAKPHFHAIAEMDNTFGRQNGAATIHLTEFQLRAILVKLAVNAAENAYGIGNADVVPISDPAVLGIVESSVGDAFEQAAKYSRGKEI